MKKTISILLVLIMGISVLAACGGEAEEPVAPVVDEPKTETTPEPTTEPVPEPVADGMNTVEITSADYGDIIFSYPDDGSVIVTLAEPGVEDRVLIPTDEFREFLGAIIQSDSNIDFQKALIAGDDFNIMVGYTNLLDGGSGHKTFDMLDNSRRPLNSEPLTYDGLDGFVFTQHVASITFPAITQYAARMILVFPNIIEEGDDVREMSKSLFEREDVQAILSTFRFPGEMLDEPRFEIQPVDNEYFSITPTDGWWFTNMSFMWHIHELQKGDMKVTTNPSSSKPASEKIDEYLDHGVYADAEEQNNVTINGREYVVLFSDRWDMFWLFTSRGDGPLDIDSDGHLMLEIRGTKNLDDVMPLLNTITVK